MALRIVNGKVVDVPPPKLYICYFKQYLPLVVLLLGAGVVT